MDKQEAVFKALCDFMYDYNIECVEDVYQTDSINEYCVVFVSKLVNIVLKGE